MSEETWTPQKGDLVRRKGSRGWTATWECWGPDDEGRIWLNNPVLRSAYPHDIEDIRKMWEPSTDASGARRGADPARRQPAEVDVERLARALCQSLAILWERMPENVHEIVQGHVRTVLADLAAQGFSVVRREDLAVVLDRIRWCESYSTLEAQDRLRAALTAAQDEP